MNTRFVSIITLISIITLTLFTRFWKLNSYPPALFSDEVDAGYQAMVFNQNRTDYFGVFFPTHFHSFSDWRTSAYIYSIAFSQKVTGNPELSVRLPSAIYSSLSVLIFYLITRSPFAALLLAISPWSIQFGRTGFEVSGMIFTILLAIYSWQRYLKNKNAIFLLASSFFFCLSPYFYSTAKLFLPIIVLIILFVWLKEILSIKPKIIFFTVLSAILFLTPLLIDTVKGHSGYRFNYISIFTQPHREQVTDRLRYEDIYSDNINKVGIKTPVISFFMHNKFELILEKFIHNYISSFSSDFLFLHGDLNLRQGFGEHGMLYIADLFLIISGLVIYFKKPTKLGSFFFWLLILAPIPFALTRDSLSPHSTRLILLLPSLIYFISLNKNVFFYPIYIFLFFNFWHYYTLHYPQISAPYWHANMKEAVQKSLTLPNRNIYYSDKFEPFLPFFLFYKPFLPTSTPSSHIARLNNDFFDGSCIDKQFCFGHINWSQKFELNSLYVIPKSEYVGLTNQNEFKIVTSITKKYLNSEEFYILEPDDNAQTK